MRDWRNESQKVTFEKIVNNQQPTNNYQPQQPNKGEPESYFWRDYYLLLSTAKWAGEKVNNKGTNRKKMAAYYSTPKDIHMI